MERQEKRIRKYRQLKEAGFNAEEATKYKDLSNYKVLQLIECREQFTESIDAEYKEMSNIIDVILKGEDYE
jgi:hypothetical protein